jgi:hypothetical protein
MEATAPELFCMTSYMELRTNMPTLLPSSESFFTEWAANVGAPDGPLNIVRAHHCLCMFANSHPQNRKPAYHYS